MTRIVEKSFRPRLATKLVAGLAVAAFLTAGSFVGAAQAGWHRGWHHHGWVGGYYGAPPVVYGGGYYGPGYYYPPPVVYGPGIGVNLPGISIGIN